MTAGILIGALAFIASIILEKLAKNGKVSPMTIFFIAYAIGLGGGLILLNNFIEGMNV